MKKYLEKDTIESIIRKAVWEKHRRDEEEYREIIEKVVEASTADAAEVKHGHWIRAGEKKKQCSECGTVSLVALPPTASACYCPACGAVMDGECRDSAAEPEAETALVIRGRWKRVNTHFWRRTKSGKVDESAFEAEFHAGVVCELCGETICVHCDPDYATAECEVGHYQCSHCGQDSKYGYEKFCPGCGAKMEGKDDNA